MRLPSSQPTAVLIFYHDGLLQLMVHSAMLSRALLRHFHQTNILTTVTGCMSGGDQIIPVSTTLSLQWKMRLRDSSRRYLVYRSSSSIVKVTWLLLTFARPSFVRDVELPIWRRTACGRGASTLSADDEYGLTSIAKCALPSHNQTHRAIPSRW